MKRSRLWIGAILAVGVLAVLAGALTSSLPAFPWGKKEAPADPVHPVLLIGLDGVEWDVALPMLRDGRLPALAALMERGFGGEIASMRPTVSPTIWTTIATGQTAEAHGIRGFTRRLPEEEGRQELYTSLDRRVPAFWNILTDLGRRVHVIGWWNTFPAEPINGVMVAQVNTLDPGETPFLKEMWKGSLFEDLEGQVYPPERRAELLELVPLVDEELPEITARVFGEFDGPLEKLERRLWENCRWSFRSDLTYHRIVLRLLQEREPFDVCAVYLGGADVAGHRFWRYLHPELYLNRPGEREVANFSGVIPAYYAYLDGLVAELLAAAPPDCNVLVVSDHGMKATNTDGIFTGQRPMRTLISGAHPQAPPGLFAAAGPDIRRRGLGAPVADLSREGLLQLGSVADVTPTLLALLGLPVGEDMVGSPMSDLLEPVFLEKHPLRTVATHTPPGWYDRRQKGPVQPPLPEERLEQLRALGYID